jgi:hypothetical protein
MILASAATGNGEADLRDILDHGQPAIAVVVSCQAFRFQAVMPGEPLQVSKLRRVPLHWRDWGYCPRALAIGLGQRSDARPAKNDMPGGLAALVVGFGVASNMPVHPP